MTRNRNTPTVSFLDLMMNSLAGFICLFVFVFMMLIIKSKMKEETDKNIESAGLFIIIVNWNDESNDDVDTYVRDPAGNLVFFRSKEKGLMHLDRDDLGARNDTLNEAGDEIAVKKNEERIIIRGIIPGEYIVNVHMYAKNDWGPTPVTIKLVRLIGDDQEVFKNEVTFWNDNEEKTAFRFTLKADGLASNFNTLPRPLTPTEI